MESLHTIAWLVCVIYSTIPLFWLMVHPRAHNLRLRSRSPYRVLVPAWMLTWIAIAAITGHWRHLRLYATPWAWLLAAVFVVMGLWLYRMSRTGFSQTQLYGIPEVAAGSHEQRLVTTGIRAHVRHPIYLGHLCEMLASSLATGLIVCWALTAFAVVTGAVMIRLEDAELERRFGPDYTAYRRRVPALLPRLVSIVNRRGS